jgi:sulfur carrier protein
MTVTINGTPREIEAPQTISSLLDALGLAGKPAVVELNREAISPRDHATTDIPDGSVIEIVTLAAGG